MADIPQIAVVASVVLAMFLGTTFGHFFFAKRVKFSAIFTSSTKTVSRTFWLPSLFLAIPCTVDVILPDIAN